MPGNAGCLASNFVDSVVTPFTWLYVPVSMLARLGAHNEFVQAHASNRIPSAASRSSCGVALIREP